MKHRRFATASWMLVPIVLAAPALISGLSLLFNWGPQWTALAIVLSVALLALMLDYRQALRYGVFGASAGIITCPLLLLLDNPAWYLFVIWIAGAMVLSALLVPLLLAPPQHGRVQHHRQQRAQAEADTREQLTAIQRIRHE